MMSNLSCPLPPPPVFSRTTGIMARSHVFHKFKGKVDSLGHVLSSDAFFLNFFSLKLHVHYTVGNAIRIQPNNCNSHCIITDRQRNTNSSDVKET